MKTTCARATEIGALLLIAAGLCTGQVITTVAGGGGNGLGDNGPATSADFTQPSGVAVDQAGNLYIADHQAHRVRKVNTSGIITTLAGTGTGGFSGDGGPANAAMLRDPYGVAVDSSGNVYISDRANLRIRKVTPAGIISTFAGTGATGFNGDGGPATSATLFNPAGIAVDNVGNLFIADAANYRVRKINSAGIISTVAGNGTPNFGGDGGPATGAGVPFPNGVALDGAGNLYISDGSNRARKVSTNGTITTIAGTGTPAFSGDGGPATSAQLSQPAGIAVDAAGNVYISDSSNDRVRKVNTAGIISTYAGGGNAQGDGGPASNSRLGLTLGLAVDSAGNLFIVDSTFTRVRRVSAGTSVVALSASPAALSFTYTIGGSVPAGQSLTVSSSAGTLALTIAASSTGNWLNVIPGTGNTPLNLGVSVTPGSLGVGLYSGTITATPPVAAGNPLSITVTLRISSGSGTISTFAGNGVTGLSGDGGAAVRAAVRNPNGLAADSAGNVFIAQSSDFRIRRVDTAGVITTYAGSGNTGFAGDGGAATSASLSPPSNGHQGIAVDAAGNLYIPDYNNHRVRKVNTSGIISTVAGSGALLDSGDGGPATSAGVRFPVSVAVDSAGNLYIAELLSARVRKVSPGGTITTFAGSGGLGSSGDGGPATSATFNAPFALAVDSAGNVYIADSTAARVRKVNAAGIITTVAGNGGHGSSADGGPATSASLDPTGIAVDSAGNIFISDQNSRVRKVSTAGIITTVAGTGVSGFSGDGGPATSALISTPNDVALDSAGNLYIADATNDRVRKVVAVGVASGGSAPAVALVANAFGETATIAPNTWVEIKGTNLAPSGHTRIWGDADFAGGTMPTSLDGVSVTVNGKKAFIYYISPTQINILTPPDSLPASVDVSVNNGSTTATTTVTGAITSPSFFVFDGTHITATHADGRIIGPTALYPGVSTPAGPNETIIVYTNGMGVTSVPIVSGSPAQSGNLPSLPVIKIGGITATVQFAGLISPGLYQLNVLVPDSVSNGDLPVTGTHNGTPMQSGVTLAVQR
jgi:uncharacterized protein (TIGR03437 family)